MKIYNVDANNSNIYEHLENASDSVYNTENICTLLTFYCPVYPDFCKGKKCIYSKRAYKMICSFK